MIGWMKAELGAVASISAGNSAPQNPRLFVDGSFPFFRTSDIGRIRVGNIEAATDNLNEEGILGLRRFPKGTILFPKSGASTFLNHRVMMVVDGYVSSHLATIVANPAHVDSRFLLYYLTTIHAQDMVQDHAYPSLNLPLIAGIEVPLPPIHEQRRIVAILDEAFEGIATAKANAEKNLQNARELGDHLRNRLFSRIATSAKRRRLGEICTFVRGPFGGSLKKTSFVGDGYAVYEQSHAIYDQFSAIRYFVNEAKFDEMRRFELRPNDLIMSCSGTMGRVAIAPLGLRRGIINQALLKLTPSISVNAEYLKYWMDSYDFQDALAQCSGGAAIQNVASVSVLKEIALPLPPLDDQQTAIDKIKRFTAEAERLHGCYERKLLALEELKKSLLHQAFTGQF